MTRHRATSFLFFAVGVAVVIWQVRSVGVDTVREGLTSVGWGLLGPVVLTLVRFTLRSYAWMALLDRPAPLRAAVAATISGDALGNVAPLGLAVSEPAKAVYLARYVPPAISLAALTAENFFYTISIAIYISLGVVAMLTLFAVPAALEWTGLVSLAGMLGVLVAAAWLARFQPTAASSMLRWVPGRRLERLIAKVARFESRTYASGNRAGGRLALIAVIEVAFHLCSMLECWFTVWLITGQSAWMAALVFDGVNRIINVVFKMIPLRAGVDEVTTTAVAEALGIGGHTGLVLALVRKVRMIVWLVVGFALWAMAPGRRGARSDATAAG